MAGPHRFLDTRKHILTALAGLLVLSQSVFSQTRENFTLGGLSAFVITPDTPAAGKPWIAYAPCVGGLPSWTGSVTAAPHYGISTTELTTNGHLYNPIDRLAGLVANGVSVFHIHIHGDSDGVVPIEQNTQIVKDYFDSNGGDATLTVTISPTAWKPGSGRIREYSTPA